MARQQKKRSSEPALAGQDRSIFGDASSDGIQTAVTSADTQAAAGTLIDEGLSDPPDSISRNASLLTAARSEAVGDLILVEQFDEQGYLRLNPDVRQAIDSGYFASGYAHYIAHGYSEGRPLPGGPRESRNVMLVTTDDDTAAQSRDAACSIDALIIAPGRGLMIVGWVDDSSRPLNCIRLVAPGWRVVIDATRFIRVRRTDVEKALGSRAQHAFGFFGFLEFDRGGQAAGPVSVELWQDGGGSTQAQCAATIVDDVELRDIALAHLANASFFGNTAIEAVGCLAMGVGGELISFNLSITKRIVSAPYVERFGPQDKTFRGSIIVCLYGKPEFYFVQNCLYSGLPGIEDYEFIYVSNSPEMAEALLREAHTASLIYGMTNTVMILSGNAGFGGANNAAARIARSQRLLIVNPDVFPRDRDWARRHTELLDAPKSRAKRLFGVPLYYDDGSLMHGGMHFDIDVGISLAGGKPVGHPICRVEHYGKGAPAETTQFVRSRPVPAVSGAFISVDRAWFEQLGGFTEDFIYGHYEDADLCLKSIQRGVAPTLEDIRMWHLEGKGSTRKPPHEGGSLVNRWLFSQLWIPTIVSGLLGPAPTHPLMQPPIFGAAPSGEAASSRNALTMGRRASA